MLYLKRWRYFTQSATQRRSRQSNAHVVDEVQTAHDLRLQLVAAAEDVGIVLHEASHAREASERAAELVAVKDSELCESKRHFAVGAALGTCKRVTGFRFCW